MKTQILDHGYVELIEHWGSDERIIESARMSTGKGFLGWGPIHSLECGMSPQFKHDRIDFGIEYLPKCTCEPKIGDEKLLRTLYTKGHTTPFEMCGMTIEVQAPIFVFREWHRHRTQSYNEFSARYSELPNLFYVPSIERLMVSKQSTTNKQSSQIGFSEVEATGLRNSIIQVYVECREDYEQLIKDGVSKEIARLVIPVSQYSKMRASANLLNWIRFLKLRLPENAQWEIRQYANVVRDELVKLFPRTMELFNEEMRGKL